MSVCTAAIIAGTRPEVIKLAPVVRALAASADRYRPVVISSGQHGSLVGRIFSAFNIQVDYELPTLGAGLTLAQITAGLLQGIDSLLTSHPPDLVLVQGDTTTVLAGALCAHYHRIPIVHVEAGLRSGQRYSPFPEELNRSMVSRLASLHLAPTEGARANLLAEGIPSSAIAVTGNTVIDSLFLALRDSPSTMPAEVQSLLALNCRILLLTVHRRESWGDPLSRICLAVRTAIEQHPDVIVAIPVHPNPKVQATVRAAMQSCSRVRLLPPLDYHVFVRLMNHSALIVTDSGGIQEEAPALGKPCIVVRTVSDRPESLCMANGILAGIDSHTIVQEIEKLLQQPPPPQVDTPCSNPFGDGHAALRILEAINRFRE